MQMRSTEAGGREHLKTEIVQSYRNCSWVFGGHGAAGRYTCDCALCDKWPLNADVVQNYRAVSAGWLGGPSALTGAMHLEGARLTNTRLLPAKGCRAPREDQQLIRFPRWNRNYPASSLLFCSPSSSTRCSLLLSSLSHLVSILSLLLNFSPLSFLFLFRWLHSFHLLYFHLFLTFSSWRFLIRSSLFSPIFPLLSFFFFLRFFHWSSLIVSGFLFFYLYHPFSLFPIFFISIGILLFHLPLSILCLSHSCNLCSLFLNITISFHLSSSSVRPCLSSLLFVTPTASNLFKMFLLVSLFFFLLFIILLSSSLFVCLCIFFSFLLSALSSPVWHPYFTIVFSSNLPALYWSYQLSGVFCWSYLLVSVCVCVCVCVSLCTPACLCGCRAERRGCGGNQAPCPTPPSPPSLLYLFFSTFFSSILFLACSPPLHQGRSSPAAEIQFRSSSSSFLCLHQLKRWAHAILSPLPALRLSDWEQVPSPCFHAVLSGCYSSVLRPAIGVYGGAERLTAGWRSLKLFIAAVGSPNLLRRWDIFSLLLPNGACGPGIMGRWLPLWRLLLCFYL